MLSTLLGDKWGTLTYDSLNYLIDIITSAGAISYDYNAEDYKLYHYDYRGSTTAITNINGNITDTVYYDPYGNNNFRKALGIPIRKSYSSI